MISDDTYAILEQISDVADLWMLMRLVLWESALFFNIILCIVINFLL